jgi:hypothetical protein
MEPYKLYVVVDAALSSGLKIPQAIHAAFTFWNQYPEIAQLWYTDSNNIVVLEDENLGSLVLDVLDQEDNPLAVSFFHEPDLGNKLTSICVEPRGWKKLSNLRLAS